MLTSLLELIHFQYKDDIVPFRRKIESINQDFMVVEGTFEEKRSYSI